MTIRLFNKLITIEQYSCSDVTGNGIDMCSEIDGDQCATTQDNTITTCYCRYGNVCNYPLLESLLINDSIVTLVTSTTTITLLSETSVADHGQQLNVAGLIVVAMIIIRKYIIIE
jgi:hypothetical protein